MMSEISQTPMIAPHEISSPSAYGLFFFSVFLVISLILYLGGHSAFADTALPGVDASSQMEGAGTLLRFIDTAIFKWSARLLAGLCICGAGWSFKEGRYGPAVISIISAFLIGTAPTWVKNIFAIGGSDSVFSSIQNETPHAIYRGVMENPHAQVTDDA